MFYAETPCSEKKIALIDERLSRIESHLENIATNSGAITSRSRVELTPSYSPQQESHSDSNLTTSNTIFEGDSSFRAHSVHASRLFEHAMSNDAFVGRSPEMEDALSSLRSLVEKQNTLSVNHDLRFPAQKEAPPVDFSSIKMPPISSVVSLLRLCKETLPFNFIDIPLINFVQFNDLCTRVYFATEDFSTAAFTLVNGGLYYLFTDVGLLRGKNVAEFQECAAMCRSNFEYALGKFDLFTSPTLENIQALILGASYAIDISRPSLCWSLSSHAARLCQALGYHRSVAAPGDSVEDIELKKRVFWYVYVIDKSLSLRLGRSSTLQEYDIALDLPAKSSDPAVRPWNLIYEFWVRLAGFNGRIYEELYSARALSDSEVDRTRKARCIIRDMEIWYEEMRKFDHTRAYNPVYCEASLSSCEITYYSLLTLVYRTIPPDPFDSSIVFSTDCIETARAALRAHQQNSARHKDRNPYIWHGYISWTLMHCPFTPFMVLFCHAIAAADLSDLRCLGEFVASLQPTGEVVEAAEKLYRLCHVFHRVAELYINAKIKASSNVQTSQNAAEDGNAALYPVNDFDPYLSALGFTSATGLAPFVSNGVSTGDVPAMENGSGVAGSTSLGDWFTGNLNIMALLEADLSNINTVNM
ncbi:hypothetical protein VTN00DRAFT_7918 [Thermoascus crustaceus]|uniref:uncharacterized protein n=1 Tax=Thermoascus crustaceus TaxID=5088 RepID=UPI003742C941